LKAADDDDGADGKKSVKKTSDAPAVESSSILSIALAFAALF
jgi:hypothetical protein